MGIRVLSQEEQKKIEWDFYTDHVPQELAEGIIKETNKFLNKEKVKLVLNGSIATDPRYIEIIRQSVIPQDNRRMGLALPSEMRAKAIARIRENPASIGKMSGALAAGLGTKEYLELLELLPKDEAFSFRPYIDLDAEKLATGFHKLTKTASSILLTDYLMVSDGHWRCQYSGVISTKGVLYAPSHNGPDPERWIGDSKEIAKRSAVYLLQYILGKTCSEKRNERNKNGCVLFDSHEYEPLRNSLQKMDFCDVCKKELKGDKRVVLQ